MSNKERRANEIKSLNLMIVGEQPKARNLIIFYCGPGTLCFMDLIGLGDTNHFETISVQGLGPLPEKVNGT